MSLTQGDSWVEEENSSGVCITLVRVGVSVVLSPLTSRDVRLVRQSWSCHNHQMKNDTVVAIDKIHVYMH